MVEEKPEHPHTPTSGFLGNFNARLLSSELRLLYQENIAFLRRFSRFIAEIGAELL